MTGIEQWISILDSSPSDLLKYSLLGTKQRKMCFLYTKNTIQPNRPIVNDIAKIHSNNVMCMYFYSNGLTDIINTTFCIHSMHEGI